METTQRPPEQDQGQQEQLVLDPYDGQAEEYSQTHIAPSSEAQHRADQQDNAVDAAHTIFDYYQPSGVKTESPESVIAEKTDKERVSEAHKDTDTIVELFSKKLDGDKSPEVQESYEAIKQKIFTESGFEPEEMKDILSCWSVFNHAGNKEDREVFKEKYLEILRNNVDRLTYINAREQGSAAELYRTYGIRNFGRYDPGMLLNQYAGRVDTDPVGVVFAAAHDWNGFLSTHNMSLGSAASNVGLNKPAVIEADSQLEAFRRLLTAKQKFGEIDKIFVAAHGDKEAIQLNIHDKSKDVSSESIEKSSAIQRLIDNGTLTEDVDIILSACYVSGLARTASKQTNGKVIATGKAIYESVYTDYKGNYRKENNKPVEIYEQGRRTDGIRRLHKFGRKVLQKVGVQLAA